MRAKSAVASASLAVVLALGSGCGRPTNEVEIVPASASPVSPPETRVEVESDPADSREKLEDLLRRVGQPRDAAAWPEDVAAQGARRLVFQCSDEVTFAARMAGDRLEVTPPGTRQGFLVLFRESADSGLRYAAPGAIFRSEGDLATLEIGRERYVDCVSNPAAVAWETTPRTGTPIR